MKSAGCKQGIATVARFVSRRQHGALGQPVDRRRRCHLSLPRLRPDQAKGGGRTKSGGYKQGIATVAMFVLVPRVKLRKRLNVARAAGRWSRGLPALIKRQVRSR